MAQLRVLLALGSMGKLNIFDKSMLKIRQYFVTYLIDWFV